jgi:acyl-CoA thioester hydrolase
MSAFKFFHPMEVRYGDLDPQGHLNNAKYLTFFEQARVQYLTKLGLFTQDQSFMDIGVIIADIHIKYEAPVLLGMPIKVGVRTVTIGNKSITLEQCLADMATDKVHASGLVILVAYDYRRRETIPVPDEWREKASQFEGHPMNET